ncbi:MAG TPA: M18 family aminopeptidase [Azonexus sp.]|jgi:aspartyl aminopeptidase|nr:M18 family aminopeptidase [Azonexus sp.]
MEISPRSREQARHLLDFIDASPSPWHAVETIADYLRRAGFVALGEDERWQLAAGGRYFVIRGGASIVAFVVGRGHLDTCGFRLVGAHTDSPGLRVKPKALQVRDGLLGLGVEVYGGPLLATFADRDLSLAGRVAVRDGDGIAMRLVHFAEPLLRLPNLAIHMNREVNESGLKFNKQTELPLLLGLAGDSPADDGRFHSLLATQVEVAPADILSWELAVCDTQPGAFWGAGQEFIADSQLDNLASCHAGLSALLGARSPATTNVCAFFDHEEVGSESASGAGGSFIGDVLRRVAAHGVRDDEGYRCALARSFFISADMAHAYHPNFPAAYEPAHRVAVNGGPVLKINANQRYSTGAESAARFIRLCEKAGVPSQQYAHRSDLGCGSTIGPLVAAGLGVASVDVGSPMWAMHSIRESAGVLDHGYMIAALTAAFSE